MLRLVLCRQCCFQTVKSKSYIIRSEATELEFKKADVASFSSAEVRVAFDAEIKAASRNACHAAKGPLIRVS
jgi:hypothetical protein